MAIIVHGTEHLVQRFGNLVRESLGPTLGPIFELPHNTDAQMEFTEKPNNLPGGPEVKHSRFYQFLEPMVSDLTTRVDLQMTETSHTHFAGSSRGAHYSVDLTDLEMIMPGAGGDGRIGPLVRIIAERYWMVTHQFHPWPGMDETEWREVVYGPAHDYALGRVIQVLGEIQGEMSERFCELRGNYDALMPIGTRAPIDPAHEAVALEPPIWHETKAFRKIDEHTSPGKSYRSHQVAHIPDGSYGVERLDETCVGRKMKRPAGERLHDEVF